MSRSEDRANGDSSTKGQREANTGRDTSYGEAVTTWFAASTLRLGLAVVGFIVLVFALGRAAGVDIFGALADALGTEVGRWLAVALFGLLLIVISLYSFDTPSW